MDHGDVKMPPQDPTANLFTEENLQKLSQIMKDIYNESLDITREFSEKAKKPSSWQLQELFYAGNLYKNFLLKLTENPVHIAEAQVSYWKDFLNLWQRSMLRMTGQQEIVEDKTSFEDKRFQDLAWEEHPFFNFVKNFYLLTAQHIQGLVHNVEGLDQKTTKKVEFFTENLINALSPSNFILTNPEVLRETINSNGQNLLKGLRNFLKDIERSRETLQISMTDLKAFKVGVNLARTPGKVIYENDLIQLIQYSPQTPEIYKVPLLIIPPWINKYYILDLSEKNSMVNWLVQQGYTVFLISWVNPDKRYRDKEFEDYMKEGPLTALDIVEKVTGVKAINVMGYCIGGTLLACTLAYLAETNQQDRIQSATHVTTLIDFEDAGDFSTFLDEDQIHIFERKMYHEGYLDGGSMAMSFNMLRANDLIWSHFIKNYLLGEEPFPFDILYWNADATNLPAKMHSFYLRGMYLRNLLVKPNALHLLGKPIDIRKINVPLYFFSAMHDHIVPWKTTYKAFKLYKCPITYSLGGSGHVAGVVNHPDRHKYNYFTNDKLEKNPDSWLKKATNHEGSWWVHWSDWLKKHSGERIPARAPGGKGIKIIEDAPGSYVKKQLIEVIH